MQKGEDLKAPGTVIPGHEIVCAECRHSNTSKTWIILDSMVKNRPKSWRLTIGSQSVWGTFREKHSQGTKGHCVGSLCCEILFEVGNWERQSQSPISVGGNLNLLDYIDSIARSPGLTSVVVWYRKISLS